MYLLATSLGILDVALFCIALVAFLLAIRFFIASKKKLETLLPHGQKKPISFNIEIDRDGFLVPAGKQQKAAATEKERPVNDQTRQEIKELRNMVQLQQLELDRALRQMEGLNTIKQERPVEDDEFKPKPEESDNDNEAEIEELQLKLYRSENKIKDLQQQVELNQKLQTHFEELQNSYAELQEKVRNSESLGWQAAETASRAESLEQAAVQLEKTVQKKEEKIRELTVENGRLHQLLAQTEGNLLEASQQRQQLTKKVSFVQEMHSDIRQMSDANQKLKTELRRMAELESMLSLISEERDVLLKRKRV